MTLETPKSYFGCAFRSSTYNCYHYIFRIFISYKTCKTKAYIFNLTLKRAILILIYLRSRSKVKKIPKGYEGPESFWRFVLRTHTLIEIGNDTWVLIATESRRKRLGLTCRRSRVLTAVLLPLAVTTGQWYETVSSARHPCVWYSRWGDAVNTRAPAYQELFLNYWIVSLSPLVTLLLLWHLSPSTL